MQTFIYAEVCSKKKYTRHRSISVNMRNSLMKMILNKGAFFDCLDKVLAFFDHLPPYLIDIFYLIRVEKKSTFWAANFERLGTQQ